MSMIFWKNVCRLSPRWISEYNFPSRINTTRSAYLAAWGSCVTSIIVVFSCLFNTSNIRSEEHTSELQSRFDLVCRLLLEKKNTQTQPHYAQKIPEQRE